MIKSSRVWITFFITFVSALVFSSLTVLAAQKAAQDSPMPPPGIPQPQTFCGYCHVLTYPDIVDKAYKTWKTGPHKEAGCVQCHYPPPPVDDQGKRIPREDLTAGTHIPKKSPAHFSYVQIGGGIIRTKPRIESQSCLTASCHGNPEDTFKTRDIKFTDKITFRHESHLKEELLPGMEVNCVTCHRQVTAETHFEVSEATCYLCHFTKARFNEGRAECETCHQLPSKTIEISDKVAVDHQKLKKANVDCISCHLDLVQAAGGSKYEVIVEDGLLKSVLVLGSGRIKEEACLRCHDDPEITEAADDSEMIHGIHVAEMNAQCFDCHRPVGHRKAEHIEDLSNDCSTCHLDSHENQRLLVAGEEREGVAALPDPMYETRTNCLGCHIKAELTGQGHSVLKASADSCVTCHTKAYGKLLPMWKKNLDRKLQAAASAEQKAFDLLGERRTGLSAADLKKAEETLEKGRRTLDIVRLGNGVHNVKYSNNLIKAAMASFEKAAELLAKDGE